MAANDPRSSDIYDTRRENYSRRFCAAKNLFLRELSSYTTWTKASSCTPRDAMLSDDSDGGASSGACGHSGSIGHRAPRERLRRLLSRTGQGTEIR